MNIEKPDWQRNCPKHGVYQAWEVWGDPTYEIEIMKNCLKCAKEEKNRFLESRFLDQTRT